MQPKDFFNLLQNPKKVNGEDARQISEILKKYPYFQSARALHLKSLKNSESANYNHQLKSAAAYTTDRSILFDFIVSEDFNQNEISKTIQLNSEQLKSISVTDPEEIIINKSIRVDDALKQSIEETQGVLDPDLFQQKVEVGEVAFFPPQLIEGSSENNSTKNPLDSENNNSIIEGSSPIVSQVETKETKKSTPEEILEIGKPLEFGKNEKHSFAEWLKLTKTKPIERDIHNTESAPHQDETNVVENEPQKNEKFQIIEKFLDKNPKIVPSKEYSPKPLLYREEINHEGLMTETLARIYLEQKNYEKAIQSYKILSLKYPEKSSFFADQIQAIKELQENNTSR